MKHTDFSDIVHKTLNRCTELLISKGVEYNTVDDRLAAFKQAAALERTSPQRALFGMMAKHIISVQNMCDTEITDYSKEQWQEKIGDAINYLLLLSGLVAEKYQEENHEEYRDSNIES